VVTPVPGPRERAPRDVLPLGDSAAYVDFLDTLDLEVNEAIQRLAASVRAREVPWIRDVVPALGGLALHFDLEHPALPAAPLRAAADLVQECVAAGPPPAADTAREIELPVCYDPALGLDLLEVAQRLELTPEEVVRLHTGTQHRVLMVGFAPGHPYLGGLDPALALPRRASPRAVVPAGSVAIANLQTSIYPFAISGGWNVIGRTPLALFDAHRAEPSLLAPRDRVRFVAITREEFDRLASGGGA
jgi:KipI family sensor histidine kinase inhibitor